MRMSRRVDDGGIELEFEGNKAIAVFPLPMKTGMSFHMPS
jgi:hypothetical protein